MPLIFALLGFVIFIVYFWIIMNQTAPKDLIKVPVRIRANHRRWNHNQSSGSK